MCKQFDETRVKENTYKMVKTYGFVESTHGSRKR